MNVDVDVEVLLIVIGCYDGDSGCAVLVEQAESKEQHTNKQTKFLRSLSQCNQVSKRASKQAGERTSKQRHDKQASKQSEASKQIASNANCSVWVLFFLMIEGFLEPLHVSRQSIGSNSQNVNKQTIKQTIQACA